MRGNSPSTLENGTEKVQSNQTLDQKNNKHSNPYNKLGLALLLFGITDLSVLFISYLTAVSVDCPDDLNKDIKDPKDCTPTTWNNIRTPMLSSTLPTGILSIAASAAFFIKGCKVSNKHAEQIDQDKNNKVQNNNTSCPN